MKSAGAGWDADFLGVASGGGAGERPDGRAGDFDVSGVGDGSRHRSGAPMGGSDCD